MGIQISLQTGTPRHRISRFVHGHFIEFLGTCIDGGVWVGEGSEIPNEGGLRTDTLEALRRIRPPVVRWPGGLYADNYHWRDGLGPRAARPRRQNLGWARLEDNAFGTHEFMRFCELIGAEPYLCCNLGTGTVEEARAWAEYCNCALDTTLARERAANGHPAPFDVKFWGLGNEVGYVLDGSMTPRYYADRARHFAGFVKLFAAQCMFAGEAPFKRIKTVLALTEGWLEPFFEAANHTAGNPNFDLLSVHLFTGRYHEDPKREFHMLMADLQGFEKKLGTYSDWCRRLTRDGHSVDIAVDEWANWRKESSHYNGLSAPVKLADGLWAAGLFHLLHRHEKVYMANVAQTCNVLSAPILTRGGGIVLTPVYHVYDLLRPHREQRLLEAVVKDNPRLQFTEAAAGEALSVCATVSDDGAEFFVSILNAAVDGPCAVCLTAEDGAALRVIEGRRLGADRLDAENTLEAPRAVAPQELGPAASADLALPAHSLTTLRLARAGGA